MACPTSSSAVSFKFRFPPQFFHSLTFRISTSCTIRDDSEINNPKFCASCDGAPSDEDKEHATNADRDKM
jgi:hypothetical protein